MRAVSIIPLKRSALAFPEPVRSLVLSEPDAIDSRELISLLGTWDRLLAMAQNTRS